MTYTGILVRGDTFDVIANNLPIQREITQAGEFLVTGVSDGSGGTNVYFLNTPVLSKIGEVLGNGTSFARFKTSDISITYDGTGLIKEASDHLLIANNYKWRFTGLQGLKASSNTTLVLTNGTTDSTIDITALVFSQSKPEGLIVTTADATVSFSSGIGVKVFNETTNTLLGFVTSSGNTLTFNTAQVTGDVITAATYDEDYNYSNKIKEIV